MRSSETLHRCSHDDLPDLAVLVALALCRRHVPDRTDRSPCHLACGVHRRCYSSRSVMTRSEQFSFAAPTFLYLGNSFELYRFYAVSHEGMSLLRAANSRVLHLSELPGRLATAVICIRDSGGSDCIHGNSTNGHSSQAVEPALSLWSSTSGKQHGLCDQHEVAEFHPKWGAEKQGFSAGLSALGSAGKRTIDLSLCLLRQKRKAALEYLAANTTVAALSRAAAVVVETMLGEKARAFAEAAVSVKHHFRQLAFRDDSAYLVALESICVCWSEYRS